MQRQYLILHGQAVKAQQTKNQLISKVFGEHCYFKVNTTLFLLKGLSRRVHAHFGSFVYVTCNDEPIATNQVQIWIVGSC